MQCPDLDKLGGEVVDTMTVLERQSHGTDGRTFSLRVRPYKNVENRIEGAVVTLFDVTHNRPTDPP